MGEYLPRKVWRWEAVGGLCLIHGYRRGVELGVKRGNFTTYLCAIMPDMHMTAVDIWGPLPARDEDGAETYSDWNHALLYAQFLQRIVPFGDRVDVLRMDTVAAAPLVPDESVDFVFVDADHTYRGVKRDIEAWLPKIRPGGMLCGHDYSWPTVRRAVDETIGKVLGVADDVWIKRI